MTYAELLSHQQQFDSALYYYNTFDSASLAPALLRTYLVSKGEFFLQQNKSQEALSYFQKSLVYQRELNDRNQIMRCLKDLSVASEKLGKDKDAFRYANESLAIAERTDPPAAMGTADTVTGVEYQLDAMRAREMLKAFRIAGATPGMNA